MSKLKKLRDFLYNIEKEYKYSLIHKRYLEEYIGEIKEEKKLKKNK
jgi:hypothetical protein